MADPKLTSKAPDGTVATRRTPRDYKFVVWVFSKQYDRKTWELSEEHSWAPARWTTRFDLAAQYANQCRQQFGVRRDDPRDVFIAEVSA